MPYLRITPEARAAMKATPGIGSLEGNKHVEEHPDGSMSFHLEASTLARMCRDRRAGESVSDLIVRVCTVIQRGRRGGR
jgi:hypothetical protein